MTPPDRLRALATRQSFDWRERLGNLVDRKAGMGPLAFSNAVVALLYEYDELPDCVLVREAPSSPEYETAEEMLTREGIVVREAPPQEQKEISHESRSPDGDGLAGEVPVSARSEHRPSFGKSASGHDNRDAGSIPADSLPIEQALARLRRRDG